MPFASALAYTAGTLRNAFPALDRSGPQATQEVADDRFRGSETEGSRLLSTKLT